eukprot:COSAG05_NODE_683_length_7951_cov_18.263500_5_plen_487_part_00
MRRGRLHKAISKVKLVNSLAGADVAPEEAIADFMAGAGNHAEEFVRSYRDAAVFRLDCLRDELLGLTAPTAAELAAIPADTPHAAEAMMGLSKAITDGVQRERGHFEAIETWSSDPIQRQREWLMEQVQTQNARQLEDVERATEAEARAAADAKLAEVEKRQETKRAAQLARHDMGVQKLWRDWQVRHMPLPLKHAARGENFACVRLLCACVRACVCLCALSLQAREAALVADLKHVEERLRHASGRDNVAQKMLAESAAKHAKLALERERETRGKETEREVLASRERDLERQVAREAREEVELADELAQVERRIVVLETQQRGHQEKQRRARGDHMSGGSGGGSKAGSAADAMKARTGHAVADTASSAMASIRASVDRLRQRRLSLAAAPELSLAPADEAGINGSNDGRQASLLLATEAEGMASLPSPQHGGLPQRRTQSSLAMSSAGEGASGVARPRFGRRASVAVSASPVPKLGQGESSMRIR